jgi:hypothetical protein
MTTTHLTQVAGFDAPIAGEFWTPTDTDGRAIQFGLEQAECLFPAESIEPIKM